MSKEPRIDLLRELCEASAPPGHEDRVRAIYRREIGPLVDRVETDGLGNVIATRSSPLEKPRRVMLAGHLDEIGFLVRHIDDDGFLRLQPLGGFDAKTLIARRVRILAEGGDVLGIIGSKPPHVMTEEERKKLPELDELFVDIGLDGKAARAKLSIGDPVTLDQTFTEIGDYVSCKALDNRVSIYTLIEALRRAHDPQVEILAVATTQEEVGLRGALTPSHRVRPDIGVAVDVTLACDVPGSKPEQYITRLRHGVGIKIFDSSLIATPKLVKRFRALAEEHDIEHQMEVLPRGGTDGGAIQRAGDAVPSITLSVPARYLHTTVEAIYVPDLEATVELLARFLETAHELDLEY